MRAFVRRGAVVVSALALVSSMGMAGAQAGEVKKGKLKICFENATALSALELDAVADGPKHREEGLLSGDCEKWKVKIGQYKITLDDSDEFFDTAFDGVFDEEALEFRFDACGEGLEPEFSAEVTRNGEDYDAFSFGSFRGGGEFPITTNVDNKKKTQVDFRLRCVVTEEDNFPA